MEFCNNVSCDKCAIIPSDERFIKTITCKILQSIQCQCTEPSKMDFCYVLFNLVFYLILHRTKKNKTMYIKLIRQGDHYIYSGSFIRKN